MTTHDRIRADEGFRSKPYQCTEGVWTFGHGLTYVTEEESRRIVDERIVRIGFALLSTYRWLDNSRRQSEPNGLRIGYGR